MNPQSKPINVRQQPVDTTAMKLDSAAMDVARRSLEQGSSWPRQPTPWDLNLIALLNDALATELVCVLRYKRHHFTAQGLAARNISQEFLKHAQQETAHADRLAKRIVQLGGEPDFSPESLSRRSHATYDASLDLKDMIKANLVAERVAIEAYSQLINLIGEKDPSSRRLLEDILSDEQEHAEELDGWLGT
jgi:bacterioferritin